MECEDTCRCYADYDTPYPHKEQTCGTRKKGYIIPCKPECCSGGCQVKIIIYLPDNHIHLGTCIQCV